MENNNRLETYVKPEMNIVEIEKDNVITTSASCIIVEMSVSWSDGSGNSFSSSGTPGN